MARVLVVDDSTSDRALLTTVLARAGHEVIEASEGKSALALASAERPDLLITDLLLPVMDGYELVRRVRSTPGIERLRTIVMSAHYDVDELTRFAEQHDVACVMAKPIRPASVIEHVEQCLVGPAPAAHDPEAMTDATEHARLVSKKLYEKVSELERSNAEVRRLLAAVVEAQESERQRIARDVHDDSIQVLTAALLQLAALRNAVPDEAVALLDQLEGSLADAVERLRSLLFDLRLSPVELGLGTAVEELLTATCDEPLSTVVDDRSTAVAPDVALVAFRIIQEAVTNAQRHARAGTISVTLEMRNRGLQVTVTDDGDGFEVGPGKPSRDAHLGLVAMRERAELAGGWCRVTTHVGSGTTVLLWLPLPSGAGVP